MMSEVVGTQISACFVEDTNFILWQQQERLVGCEQADVRQVTDQVFPTNLYVLKALVLWLLNK